MPKTHFVDSKGIFDQNKADEVLKQHSGSIDLEEAAAILDTAVKEVADDIGVVFEPRVLGTLAWLKKNAQPDFFRRRDQIKRANPAVSLPELDRAISAGARRNDEADKTNNEHVCPYLVKNGALTRVQETRNGPVENPLCGFDARILEEITRDDGAEQKKLFRIVGTLASGQSLPEADVSVSRFSGMNWISEEWGNDAVVYAGASNRDHLRCAIQVLSTNVKKRMVYAHTGWRQIDGEWCFLHGGGALGANGNREDIEVEPDERNRMTLYRLPGDDGDFRSAVATSLRLFQIAPDRPEIGAVLVSSIARAPTSELWPGDHTVFLAGPTGSFKSELTALALACFGQDFSARSFPATWEDTVTDVEIKSYRAKDVIFVIDDFAPRGSGYDVKRLHGHADRVMRGAGNQAGRGRRTSTLGARPAYYPRGLIMSSGEDVPRGQSLRGRMVIVELQQSDVDRDTLTRLQRAARDGMLAQAMSAYVRWAAPRLDELRRRARSQRDAGRRMSIGSHPRHPDTFASMLFGLDLFLEFAHDIGVVNTSDLEEYKRIGHAALCTLIEQQAGHQHDADDVARFLGLLQSAIDGHRCHFRQRTTDSEGEIAKPGAWIGWEDEEFLYLDPEAAYGLIQRLSQEQDHPFTMTKATIFRRLVERKFALTDRLGRNTSRITVGTAKRKNVIKLHRSALTDTANLDTPSLAEVDQVDQAHGKHRFEAVSAGPVVDADRTTWSSSTTQADPRSYREMPDKPAGGPDGPLGPRNSDSHLSDGRFVTDDDDAYVPGADHGLEDEEALL